MTIVEHLTTPELKAGLEHILLSPKDGCQKFKSRFGADAWKFTYWSKHLRFRGINAKVVQAGTLRVGDLARKVN